MLRFDLSLITLTTGEVKAAEHRRRFRKHLEEQTTFTSPGRTQVDGKQKIEKEEAQHSQATFGSALKSEAAQFTILDTNQRVLGSIPPQSPRSLGEVIAILPATTSQAQERAQQRNDEGPAPRDDDPPMPRLLAMTPRRLGPAVIFPATSLSHETAPVNVGAGEGAESSVTNVSSLATESPDRPFLFSRPTHVNSVEYIAPLPTGDRDELPSTPYSLVPRSIRAVRPATPTRRSSLSLGFRLRSLDGEADNGPVSLRTRSHRNRHVQPNTFSHASRLPITPRTTVPTPAGPTSATPSPRPVRVRVYDDSLPPWRQPETPSNLPESRHQSRLSGAYTAPARRNASHHHVTPATSRRWRINRSPSPVGLQNPGMLGLYGGLENTHDDILYERVQRDLNEANWTDEVALHDE